MGFIDEQMYKSSSSWQGGRLKRWGNIKNILFYSEKYSYHSCSIKLALFCPQKTHDFLESEDFSASCKLLQQK